MLTISPDTAVQTVVTTFETNPGQCGDLIEALRTAYAEHISKAPGFLGAAIHMNDAQTRIANYAQWQKREDFLAMLRSDAMRAHTKRFAELCRGFEPVMYEVVEAFE